MRAEVLAAVRDTERAVVLFDIDSTLLSTGGRHLSILRAYAAESADPELLSLAERLTPADFGWTVDGPLPAELDRHREPLRAFWWEGFFSDAHLFDQPTPGALSFVEKVHRAGGWVYYLTARDLPSMGAGTARQLLDLGFPLLSGRATLHLKPSRSLSDDAFKEQAVKAVRRAGTVVATYENEPKNANLFATSFPGARHFLLDTVHTPGAPELRPEVRIIPDFQA